MNSLEMLVLFFFVCAAVPGLWGSMCICQVRTCFISCSPIWVLFSDAKRGCTPSRNCFYMGRNIFCVVIEQSALRNKFCANAGGANILKHLLWDKLTVHSMLSISLWIDRDPLSVPPNKAVQNFRVGLHLMHFFIALQPSICVHSRSPLD